MNIKTSVQVFISNIINYFITTYSNDAKINLYINIDILLSQFYTLYPDAVVQTKGLFMRTVNCIINKTQYISSITQRTRYGKDHFIILNSDIGHESKDLNPMMISDINDPKIKFISDMISDIQSTKPHKEPTEMPESPDTSMSSKNSASSTYPLLDSLGIDTNLDTNEEQLLNLLSEMVLLLKKTINQ